MTERARVLVVDDEDVLCAALGRAVACLGYRVTTVRSGAEALQLVRRHHFDAALLDIRMPEMDGLELLREIRRQDRAVQVVMVTGYPGVETAVEALKQGARDYITKPFSVEALGRILGEVLARHAPRGEAGALRSHGEDSPPLQEMVLACPLMHDVQTIFTNVAPTDSPVLIEGESGTGKELVAGVIHRLSRRSKGPFIPVNCGAIPGELLESELFGHVRGAFTGAVADAVGLFRSADGGTLFLDEVTELPAGLQVKLLRVLEDKAVRPVGSAKTRAVDARIIAATNRRLEEAIKDRSLREDFFYRLNVVRITVPPLRDRKAAIPALVAAFVRKFNQRFDRQVRGITSQAMAALMAYDFPGNVRELENLIERAYALGATEEIALADLPVLPGAPRGDRRASRPVPSIAEAERELILRTLRLCDDNKRNAARTLGISRRTLYRRLKDYGLL